MDSVSTGCTGAGLVSDSLLGLEIALFSSGLGRSVVFSSASAASNFISELSVAG